VPETREGLVLEDERKSSHFEVVVQFESVLKGNGFSRAVKIAFSLRLSPLRDGKFQTAPLPISRATFPRMTI
jgi:hypothetical protein